MPDGVVSDKILRQLCRRDTPKSSCRPYTRPWTYESGCLMKTFIVVFLGIATATAATRS